MKAIKLVSIIMFIGLFSLFLLGYSERTIVKGSTTNAGSELSNYDYIFDTSEITMNNKDYTVLLKREGIQVIDDSGSAFKTMDYPEHVAAIIDSDHVRDAFSESGVLNKEIIDLKLNTTGDIDNEGVNDFLLTIRSRRFKTFNQVVTISYESSDVIWEYKPTIKSSKLCSFSTFCEEPADLMQVELRNQSVYVVSGYSLEQINLETGSIENQFHYTNNIWNLEFISDINEDDRGDLAIAVQPSKVLFLDGKTLRQVHELEVAKDLKLTKLKTIKLNVRDLEFLSSHNRLMAASEDGNVYEIDIHKNEIVDKTQIFSIEQLIEFYKDLKYSNQNMNLEFYYDGETKYYLSGIKAPVTLNLVGLPSIDEDDLDDYIIEWTMSEQDTTSSQKEMGQFRIQNTSSDPVIFEGADLQFTKDDIIVYKGFGYLNLWHLFEKRNLLYSNHQVHPAATLKDHSNGMIMIDPKPKVTQFSLDSFGVLQSNWLIDSPEIKQEEVLASNDYLLKTERQFINGGNIDYFELYDKDYKLIKTYQTESGSFFLYKKLADEKLYIVEADNKKQVLTTKCFDNETGDLLFERLFDYNKYYETTADEKLDRVFNAITYQDVTGDHVNEILVVNTFDDTYNKRNMQKYFIYDLVNAELLVENTNDIKQADLYKVHDDLNNDGYKELLTHTIRSYFFYDRTVLDVSIYKTSGDDLFNSENVEQKSIDIPYGDYEFIEEVDLNNDGYDEFIMNFTDIVYTHEKGLYIFDYKNELLLKVGDFSNNDYRIVDLDGNGTKELITIEPKSLVSSELAIHNYRNGQISTPNTYLIDGFYSETPTKEYVVYDQNNDGVKDFIFAKHDQNHNIQIEVLDYKLKKIIHTKNYNLYNRQTDELSDDLGFSNIELNLFNDEPYIIVQQSGMDYEKSEFSYTIKKRIEPIKEQFLLFDPDTFELEYAYGEEQNPKQRMFYKTNDGPIFMKNAIKHGDIETLLTGFYDTNYHFNLNQDINVERVLAIINDETIKSTSILEFDQGEFDLKLSNGDYNLTFYIYTEDGNSYLYHDRVTVSHDFTDSFIYQGVILSIGSLVFLGASIIIKKYIHK